MLEKIARAVRSAYRHGVEMVERLLQPADGIAPRDAGSRTDEGPVPGMPDSSAQGSGGGVQG